MEPEGDVLGDGPEEARRRAGTAKSWWVADFERSIPPWRRRHLRMTQWNGALPGRYERRRLSSRRRADKQMARPRSCAASPGSGTASPGLRAKSSWVGGEGRLRSGAAAGGAGKGGAGRRGSPDGGAGRRYGCGRGRPGDGGLVTARSSRRRPSPCTHRPSA